LAADKARDRAEKAFKKARRAFTVATRLAKEARAELLLKYLRAEDVTGLIMLCKISNLQAREAINQFQKDEQNEGYFQERAELQKLLDHERRLKMDPNTTPRQLAYVQTMKERLADRYITH
jgi:succinate dehydrogenase/fumarate reductase flavoprotein subunit